MSKLYAPRLDMMWKRETWRIPVLSLRFGTAARVLLHIPQ